ncbi:MAG: hypothetical protein LBL13_02585, partial [Bacteroidales bacterium]|nr:hypothetical protein [Bacteroidales bacterium]
IFQKVCRAENLQNEGMSRIKIRLPVHLFTCLPTTIALKNTDKTNPIIHLDIAISVSMNLFFR